jgi:hypothetical protein
LFYRLPQIVLEIGPKSMILPATLNRTATSSGSLATAISALSRGKRASAWRRKPG